MGFNMKDIRLTEDKPDFKVCPHITINALLDDSTYEYKEWLYIHCSKCKKTFQYSISVN